MSEKYDCDRAEVAASRQFSLIAYLYGLNRIKQLSKIIHANLFNSLHFFVEKITKRSPIVGSVVHTMNIPVINCEFALVITCNLNAIGSHYGPSRSEFTRVILLYSVPKDMLLHRTGDLHQLPYY